jgi:hypothetical protein
MTHEENEEIQTQLPKLDNQINELNDRSVKKVDLINTQTKYGRKMDGNKELMEIKMEQLEHKMDGKLEQMEQKIIEALIGRLPKIDKVSKGTHENKGSIQVEQLSKNKIFLGGFNSKHGVTYGWFPKGVNLPTVELKKFDGTKVFT